MKNILIYLCCFVMSFTLFAQDNNSDYESFLKYKALAEESFASGDYDESIEMAQMALEYGDASLATNIENNSAMAQNDEQTEQTNSNTQMQAEVKAIKLLSMVALEKKALESIKKLESLGGNTNTYTKNVYTDLSSSNMYNISYNEYDAPLDSSNYYSNGFQTAIDVSMSAIDMIESLDFYGDIKEEDIITENDTNDIYITAMYSNASSSLASRDFNSANNNIEKVNNLMTNIKYYAVSENVHNLAYLTFKNAFDDKENKLDEALHNEVYNMLYLSQEALSMKNYNEVTSQSMAIINILATNNYPTPILPSLYKVRLVTPRRDSLSRISGYSFIYGDISQWRPIYELNKDIMVETNNPNLIEPDQILAIPKKIWELRDGEYLVNKGYLIVRGRATKAPVLEPLITEADTRVYKLEPFNE